MADDPVDGVSDKDSALPRRRALKRVGQIVAAAAVGLTAGKVTEVEAVGAASRGTTKRVKTLRKLTLEAILPSGKKVHFSVPENFPGAIIHNGQTFSVVPKSAANGGVELAVHKGRAITNTPLATLVLGVGGAVTPASLDTLPVVGFAAYWAGSSVVPEDYTPMSDCTCFCECPPFYTLIGCACCCEKDFPECGWCWVPPCSYNCNVPPAE